MDETDEFSRLAYLFLPRPRGQLRLLPVNFRWEVTRRHPIYGQFWTAARTFFDWARTSDGTVSEADLPALQVASIAARFLNEIGVTSFAPDPRLEFAQLGEGVNENGWLGGSISPITLRGIWGLLIATLPAEVFSATASQISAAMLTELEPNERRNAGLQALQQIQEMRLDQMINEPIVSINPTVSDRQIHHDLSPLLERWRAERNISVGRDRSASYRDYLRVWDLREGWAVGVYSNENEKTLGEVAAELDINPSTANMRYRSAFELITGYTYSAPTWVRFMGWEKLSTVTQEVIGKVARKRPIKLRSKREVPESALGGKRTVELMASSQEDAASQSSERVTDLLIDIDEFVKKGKLNIEIRDALEVPSESITAIDELIELFRARR